MCVRTPRLETTLLFLFIPPLLLLCRSRQPDRGVLKCGQVLRKDRGCHGDIVAVSCSLLHPLYAWCKQRAILAFDSVQQHYVMVFGFQ
ncbi:predicted protein [Lichtheimia corymbifera JMRC:FSU:9682]|uniref:Secreted protein n=1 Tax=Lichtheimia corymbifera JMRC:FSU:9682 TaxID=1263082 RepID=A0A068RQN8_9FUNG|nr:predicted protein [Lichtheimia corymbifera JMRC:FSU:9682]